MLLALLAMALVKDVEVLERVLLEVEAAGALVQALAEEAAELARTLAEKDAEMLCDATPERSQASVWN